MGDGMGNLAVLSVSREGPGTAEKGLAIRRPCSRLARRLRALALRGEIAGVRAVRSRLLAAPLRGAASTRYPLLRSLRHQTLSNNGGRRF